MPARIRLKHLPYDRGKIQVGVLLQRLVDCALGKIKLHASQIRAADIVLRKALPDLATVEHKGEMTEPVHYYAEIPQKAASTQEWIAGNPITSPAKPKLGGRKGRS